MIVWVPPWNCAKSDAEVQLTLKEKPQTATAEQHTLKLATPAPRWRLTPHRIYSFNGPRSGEDSRLTSAALLSTVFMRCG